MTICTKQEAHIAYLYGLLKVDLQTQQKKPAFSEINSQKFNSSQNS